MLIVAFVGLPFALLGCAPSLVGPDTAAYSMGSLHARVNSDVASVYKASVSALEKLEIKVVDSKKDVFGAKVIGRTSDEQTVEIKIKPEGQSSTHFTIHVGSFGNETRSRTIYDQIRKELGLGAEK
jgi:Protein of unknown function (DUF3568)